MAEAQNRDTPKTGRRAKLADARDAAFDRARSTVQGLEANPVGVLVGGLAVGLIAGALVPRSDRERTALRPVGKRLAEGAVAALAAARDTGREQIGAALLGGDAAKNGVQKVFDSALSAAKGGSSETSNDGNSDSDRRAPDVASPAGVA